MCNMKKKKKKKAQQDIRLFCISMAVPSEEWQADLHSHS